MRYFPMFLDLDGRIILLAGGGEQAAQKSRLLRRTGADLLVMAEEVEPELAALIASGRARHIPATYDEASVDRAHIVFAASGCVGVDAMIAARAGARGVPVNVVDRPKLCTALTPALLDRDPLVVAIGTEGKAPVMAREVRAALEATLEPTLGGLVALAGRMRGAVEDALPHSARRAFWDWVFTGPPRALWRRGEEAAAEAAMRAALRDGGAPRGAIHTVVILPEVADLLPLRAVQRLQSADLVLHGEGAESALELARRDADRAALATAATLPATGRTVILARPAERSLAERLLSTGAAEAVREWIEPAPATAAPNGQLAGIT